MNFSNVIYFLAAVLVAGIIPAEAQDIPSLKKTFESHFLVGAALNNNQFSQHDSSGASIVKYHCNSITPENVLKWERVHPQPGKYAFEEPDKFVQFGLENNMFIVGHTLVWHSQTPKWVFEIDSVKPADRETLLNRMRDHILTVVGRYKGKIKAWDVVNEALNEDGSLRQSPWLKIIGEDYIEKAFQYAHEADPDAELYYNDYSLENSPKRNGAVELLKKLKAKGIKISGVGIQGHYQLVWPTTDQIDSTIKAFSELGLKSMITELDVDVLPHPDDDYRSEINKNYELQAKLDPYKKALPDSVQQELAKRYSEIFSVFVKNSKSIDRITFWGVKDSDSWLNNWPVIGRTSYPLLFDQHGAPKPAFLSVIKTVDMFIE